MEKYYDVVIVGAGLSGATMAEHCARAGASVLVIDKRTHIGGNVYDKVEEESGIRISLYGAHLFHTNDTEVWDYVQRFGTWARWDHSVVADVSGVMIPLPININTVNTLYNTHLSDADEMKTWLSREPGVGSAANGSAASSKEAAINKCGERIYSALFESYTKKQWGRDASELDASVLERIPLRTNFDNRYFTDKYQALPKDGYTSVVEKMLTSPLISVVLGVSWADFKTLGVTSGVLIFTGPIDTYFDNAGLPLLEYRSINFEWYKMPCVGYHQPGAVVNYPGTNNKYTRSVEYKYFLNQRSDFTIVAYETTCSEGEPYYPIPNAVNRATYEKYKALASAEFGKGVHFIGRLASYKYFNMDQAIRASIDYFKEFITVEVLRLVGERPHVVISEAEAEAEAEAEVVINI